MGISGQPLFFARAGLAFWGFEHGYQLVIAHILFTLLAPFGITHAQHVIIALGPLHTLQPAADLVNGARE